MKHIMSRKSRYSNLRIRILSTIMGVLIFQVSSIFSPLKPLSLIRDAEGVSTNQWEVQSPEMNANWLNDIWADSDHNVFVVGYGMNGATIGHYDGQTWRTMESYIMAEPAGELTAIWGSSANNIFAVGGTIVQNYGRTMILHYNGAAWSIMNADFPGCLFDVWGSGANDVFAAGLGGLIIHWNGQTWAQMNIDAAINLANSAPDIQGIWGDGPNNVFCVGTCANINSQQTVSTIMHYQDGQWSRLQEIPSVSLYDIWGASGGGAGSASGSDIWAAGDRIYRCQGGGIWQGTGSGSGSGGTGSGTWVGTWVDVTPSNIPEGFYLNRIAGRAANDIMAVGTTDIYGDEGLVIRYNGQTWEKAQGVSVSGYIRSAWLGQNNKAVVVGGKYQYEYPSQGIVLIYDGTTWYDQSAKGYEGTYFQTWVNSSKDVYAVGGYLNDPYTDELARVAITHYDGQYWTPVNVAVEGILYDIWGTAGAQGATGTSAGTGTGAGTGELFAVGGNMYWDDYDQVVTETEILRSTNGTVWTKMSSAQNFDDVLYGVWGTSASDVFAVGEGIYHYNGTTWSKMASPSTAGILNCVWGSDPMNVFAVGYCKNEAGTAQQKKATILRYNGQSWTSMSHTIQGNLFKVWGTSATDVFAIGEESVYSGTGTDATISYYAKIYHYNGVSWSAMDCPLVNSFYDIWGTAGGSGGSGAGTAGMNVFVAYDTITTTPSGTETFQCGILYYDGQSWIDTGFVPAYGPLLGLGGIAGGAAGGTAGTGAGGIAGTGGAGGYGVSELFVVGDIGTVLHLKTDAGTKQKIFLQQGWNLISFQVNVCIYKGARPSADMLINVAGTGTGAGTGAGAVEFREVDDLKAWLCSTADSLIRDYADPQQAGDWQRITSFDATGAHLLDKNVPSYANTLSYLAAGYGYWVKMNRPGYLVLSGQTIPTATTGAGGAPASSTSFHMQAGWNLIGPLSPDTCYYQGAQPPCPMQETPTVNLVPTSGPALATALASISGKYLRVTGFDCGGAKLYDTSVPSYACTLKYLAPGYGYWVKMTQEGVLTP